MVRYGHSQSGEIANLNIKKLGRIEMVAIVSPEIVSNANVGPAGSNRPCAWTTTAAWPTPNYWLMKEPATSHCFLLLAAGWFAKHGVTINRVLTNNGSGYKHRLFLNAGLE